MRLHIIYIIMPVRLDTACAGCKMQRPYACSCIASATRMYIASYIASAT